MCQPILTFSSHRPSHWTMGNGAIVQFPVWASDATPTVRTSGWLMMMTSKHGNTFRIIALLWGKTTGDRWFPHSRSVMRSLDDAFVDKHKELWNNVMWRHYSGFFYCIALSRALNLVWFAHIYFLALMDSCDSNTHIVHDDFIRIYYSGWLNSLVSVNAIWCHDFKSTLTDTYMLQ